MNTVSGLSTCFMSWKLHATACVNVCACRVLRAECCVLWPVRCASYPKHTPCTQTNVKMPGSRDGCFLVFLRQISACAKPSAPRESSRIPAEYWLCGRISVTVGHPQPMLKSARVVGDFNMLGAVLGDTGGHTHWARTITPGSGAPYIRWVVGKLRHAGSPDYVLERAQLRQTLQQRCDEWQIRAALW